MNPTSPSKSVDAITSASILTNNLKAENLTAPAAGNPSPAWGSQAPNNCSLPKSVENNTENLGHEKHTDATYAERREKCMHDLETLTGQALKLAYPAEYTAWRNGKHRSKTYKKITGPRWGVELETFPGFLKRVGPRPTDEDSLDRIDPIMGYVVGNLRWAPPQLQSDNRKNVEIFLVRGVPLTKPQLANFLGITYDALRMRLHRGETVEDILADHIRTDPKPSKSPAAKIEACPWPEGKESAWEAAFKAERQQLLLPEQRESRTAFLVAKSILEFRRINNTVMQYGEDHGPDSKLPPKLQEVHEYWRRLRIYAWAQRELVVREDAPAQYSVDPTGDELDQIADVLAPSSLTDEDIHRQD
jgi:hypothetical protein